jgi:hypothetical protein
MKEKIINLIKDHQQKIALILGFIAVATIGFYGGLNLNRKSSVNAPVTAASNNSYYTQKEASTQTAPVESIEAKTSSESLPVSPDCGGKIKGSSSHKYHMPGGAFYTRTTHPIACFATEAEAVAAGFAKSSR